DSAGGSGDKCSLLCGVSHVHKDAMHRAVGTLKRPFRPLHRMKETPCGSGSATGSARGTACETSLVHQGVQPGVGVGDLALLDRSEEHTSELQSRFDLVCRLL